MDVSHGSPASSHRGEWTSGSDGATRTDASYSPGRFAQYTQPNLNSPHYAYAGDQRSTGFSPARISNYPKLTPDWDPRLVIPNPTSSFIARLARPQDNTDVSMKQVNLFTKTFKLRYAARTDDDWTEHIDKLEIDVFQMEDFNSKQCYYAIKRTIFGEPERSLGRLYSQ